MRLTPSLALLLALGVGGTAAAQVPDVRAELATRGAPAAFIERVGAAVDAARAQGLPPAPLVDKALEGWAKHVPSARVLAVLEQVRERLVDGRAAAVRAGMVDPPGAVVVGAADALGRGMSPDDVRDLVGSAADPTQAAAGLTVAASLCAQGLDHAAAVRAVQESYRGHATAEELFELPSAVAEMTGRGIAMTDIARRIMQGGGLPLPVMGGAGGGRPGTVPPGRGKGTGNVHKQ
jgi:hypothetical protein